MKSNAALDRLAAEWMGWETWTKEWSPTTNGCHMLDLLAEVERRGLSWAIYHDPIGGDGYNIYEVEIDEGNYLQDKKSELSDVWADTPGRAVVIAVLAMENK